mgnify:CR=1 FL=1
MNDRNAKIVFWGCFIALITTAFAFVGRLFLINDWATEFGLDPAQAGRLAGIGVWPFAVSIIGFSLVIDRIGYKVAMYVAAAGHVLWAVMGVAAYFVSKGGDPKTAYQLVYWGSLVAALANGTVEAFINPVVATMFSKEKTKWLNILHAGWPGGLVLAGMITIFMGDIEWWIKVGMIAIPAVVYLIMLLKVEFPKHERETAGVSYRAMLQEFGIGGALVVGVLLVLQLMDFFSNGSTIVLPGWQKILFIAIGVGLVAAFGAYTKTMGRGLLFFLIIIMMPLATTEIGTDGWITGIMEGIAEKNDFHPGWVLVYTSVIMAVLRFFAGPIVHKLSALGLLALSAVRAIVGLWSLSFTTGLMIFGAATLYGIGKTFFWPTMLGVVAEQTPKGGALTLNAISGIGMLAVGTLGFPYIGVLQTKSEQAAIVQSVEVQEAIPGLVADGTVTTLVEKSQYEVMKYKTVDDDGVKALVSQLPEDKQESASNLLAETRAESKQKALADMTLFPVFMLICYIILMLYFRSKGGYKPIDLHGSESADEGHAATEA